MPRTSPAPAARRRRRRALLVALLAGAGAAGALPVVDAQQNPVADLFTTTTRPRPAAPTTTAPAAPAGAVDAGGDGAAPPSGGIEVPPEAQRIIDAVRRSRPNSSERLVAGLAQLTDLGATPEEAARLGLGRFPVAGVARYSHDWLFPRYGPGFRFHLGTDVFAERGTPVRAPVDGVATTSSDPLGGLTVSVTMPDRTRFYLAHLAALVEGFQDGMAVTTGDVLGYVGDSGNARGGSPHVHVGVYPKGGPPVDPKAVLDQFLADAEAALPAVVEAYRAAHPPAPIVAVPFVDLEARRLRPVLATSVLRERVAGDGWWSPAVLFLLSSAPDGNVGRLLQGAVDDLRRSIDWSARG